MASTWKSKTRFLTPKNLKKFEVSCTGRNTQKQIQEILKTSIPILKTQIKGRERSEGEKDWGRGDPGRPKLRQPRREPQAWVARGLGRPRCASPRPGLRMMVWSHQLRSPISIFSPFLFLVFFFFFSSGFFYDVLVVPLWFVLIYKGYKLSLRDSISM